jgi:hypothetical protein
MGIDASIEPIDQPSKVVGSQVHKLAKDRKLMQKPKVSSANEWGFARIGLQLVQSLSA